MGLDAVFQQVTYAGYELWAWLRYEAWVHPFIFLGVGIIIIAAFVMYKTRVRDK